jgi:hypothetical protein
MAAEAIAMGSAMRDDERAATEIDTPAAPDGTAGVQTTER